MFRQPLRRTAVAGTALAWLQSVVDEKTALCASRLAAYPANRFLAQDLARLQAIEWDALKGQLAGLRAYTQIGTHDNYLKATTQDVILTCGRRKWEAGAYSVYLPRSAFIKDVMGGVHLVPERNPNATCRHPHHIAYHTSQGPLAANPAWCQAEFTTLFSAALSVVDVVALLRAIFLFLSRYNPYSPLREIELCTHIHEVVE